MESTPQADRLFTDHDIVFIAVAHPDDETVLHSEIIRRAVQAKAKVHIALATVGEASTVNNRFWRPQFVQTKQRWREAQEAARRMGVPLDNLHNLALADGECQQIIPVLTEKIGDLLLRHHATKVVTTGSRGYDGHLDHIAVDAAVMHALRHATEVSVLRLNAEGQGRIVLPVDRRYKIRAATAHFSQFPGFQLFGHTWLPPRTKRYLNRYQPLLRQETYDLSQSPNQ